MKFAGNLEYKVVITRDAKEQLSQILRYLRQELGSGQGADMSFFLLAIQTITWVVLAESATKVLFSRSANKAENEYLNYLSSESNIQWNDEIIYMPFELGDQTVIYKNQRVSKIKLRGLTNQYKEGLLYITNQIMGEENFQTLRKVFKKVEKGV